MVAYQKLQFDPRTKNLRVQNFMELTTLGWFPRDLGEIGITLEYFRVLRDIYRVEGLKGVIKHEVKASIHSSYYRLCNLLNPTVDFDNRVKANVSNRHEAILTDRFKK